tara:strand:+ start:233 stop:895 length:663 start_codon:yes stop_codon:yes gene_type:complete
MKGLEWLLAGMVFFGGCNQARHRQEVVQSYQQSSFSQIEDFFMGLYQRKPTLFSVTPEKDTLLYKDSPLYSLSIMEKAGKDRSDEEGFFPMQLTYREGKSSDSMTFVVGISNDYTSQRYELSFNYSENKDVCFVSKLTEDGSSFQGVAYNDAEFLSNVKDYIHVMLEYYFKRGMKRKFRQRKEILEGKVQDAIEYLFRPEYKSPNQDVPTPSFSSGLAMR